MCEGHHPEHCWLCDVYRRRLPRHRVPQQPRGQELLRDQRGQGQRHGESQRPFGMQNAINIKMQNTFNYLKFS